MASPNQEAASSTSTPVDPASPLALPVAPAPYAPNYKYKVMDKEKEIPEFLRGAMKDATTEKQLRELFEKADGLEVVKPRFKETREQLTSTRAELESYKTSIGELREQYKTGDFDGFFAKLNIPQEKIVQWLLDKAQYQQLPDDQRSVIDNQKNAEQRARQSEKQLSEREEYYQEQMVQAKDRDLEYSLSSPEVASIAQAFDEKHGPGSFRDAVIECGEIHHYRSNGKIDLTPEQAIQEVLKRRGLSPQAAAPAPQAPVAAAPGGETATPQRQPAPQVIPNVSGRTQSPMAGKPRSIEDLKKKYAAMT